MTNFREDPDHTERMEREEAQKRHIEDLSRRLRQERLRLEEQSSRPKPWPKR